jgi:hypothetical protein
LITWVSFYCCWFSCINFCWCHCFFLFEFF